MTTQHGFNIVSLGPPAFTAKCSCREWYIAWDADELRRFDDLATVEAAARADHATHAQSRAGTEARAARTGDFY